MSFTSYIRDICHPFSAPVKLFYSFVNCLFDTKTMTQCIANKQPALACHYVIYKHCCVFVLINEVQILITPLMMDIHNEDSIDNL